MQRGEISGEAGEIEGGRCGKEADSRARMYHGGDNIDNWHTTTHNGILRLIRVCDTAAGRERLPDKAIYGRGAFSSTTTFGVEMMSGDASNDVCA